ncbi:MAG: DUF4215 domain-containing protein [bacterium]
MQHKPSLSSPWAVCLSLSFYLFILPVLLTEMSIAHAGSLWDQIVDPVQTQEMAECKENSQLYNDEQGTQPHTLRKEAKDRTFQSVDGKPMITSGRIKPCITVDVDKFFIRYGSSDFGLKPGQDLAIKDQASTKKIDEKQYSYSFKQYFKPAEGAMVPVYGSRTTLIAEGTNVTYFTQNFVRDLETKIKSTTPKITLWEAKEIAKQALGEPSVYEPPPPTQYSKTTSQAPQIPTAEEAGQNSEETARRTEIDRRILAGEPTSSSAPVGENVEANAPVRTNPTTEVNEPNLRAPTEPTAPSRELPVGAGIEAQAPAGADTSGRNVGSGSAVGVQTPAEAKAPGPITGAGTSTLAPPGLVPEENLRIGFDGVRDAEHALLVWSFTEESEEGEIFQLQVDAMTGKIINQNNISYYLEYPSPMGLEQDLLAGQNVISTGVPYPFYGKAPGYTVKFTGSKNEKFGPYNLSCKKSEDPSAPCPSNIILINGMGKNTAGAVAFFDADGNYTDPDQQAPVSLINVLQTVGNYFQKVYQWTGFQNKPEDVIFAYLNNYQRYSPLFNKPAPSSKYVHDQYKEYLVFNGTGSAELNMTPLVSIDVVAHEYHHGIFDNAVNPDETGSLSEIMMIAEGLADFFGEVIENNDVNPWKIGDQIFKNNTFLRNLMVPHNGKVPYPNTYLGYYFFTDKGCPKGGGYCIHDDPSAWDWNKTTPCNEANSYCDKRHRNSTVISHMLYLLSEGSGGKLVANDHNHEVIIAGIGKARTARLAWDTMFKLAPTDNMRDFCLKLVKEAEATAQKESDESLKNTIAKSAQDACFAVGILSRNEVREYSPSEKSADNMDVEPWPSKVSFQVFPEKGENHWVAEVSDNDFNGNFVPTSKQFTPDLQSDFREAKDVIQKNGKSYVNMEFYLRPNSVYFWHICADPNADPAKKSELGLPSQAQKNCSEWNSEQFFVTEKKLLKVNYPKGGVVVDWANRDVLFQWDGVSGADHYVIKYYEMQNDGSPGKELGIGTTIVPAGGNSQDKAMSAHGVLQGAYPQHGLCWSVQAWGPNNSLGMESGINCWKVKPEIPSNLSPSGEGPMLPKGFSFSWKGGGAKEYDIEVCQRNPNNNQPKTYKDASCPMPRVKESPWKPDDPQWYPEWYWPEGICFRVAGVSDFEVEGDFSPWACYQPKLPAPNLISPADNAVLSYSQAKTTFTWSAVPEAKKYEFLMENTVGFKEDSYITAGPNELSYTTKDATDNTSAKIWKVRALFGDELLPGPYSTPRKFTVPPADKPTLKTPGEGELIPYDGVQKKFIAHYSWVGTPKVPGCGYAVVSWDGAGNAPNFGCGCSGQKVYEATQQLVYAEPNQNWNAKVVAIEAEGKCTESDVVHFKTAGFECGNKIVEPGEKCDDGNTADGDGCDSNCTPTGCGNKIMSGNEECDDGNLVNEDTCTSQCKLNQCGDGVPGGPNEQCDHGQSNGKPGDSCGADCKLKCGNAKVEENEECDDGNQSNNDQCLNACELNVCGDGYVYTGKEQCDDGGYNGQPGHCNKTCDGTVPLPAKCGDGKVDPGEQCEPPNTSTCDSTCHTIACNPPTLAPPDLEVSPILGTVYYQGTPASMVSAQAQLSWGAVPGATSYRVEIIDSKNLNIINGCDPTHSPIFLGQCVSPLISGDKYIITVKPRGCGKLGPSAIPLGVVIQ